MPGNEDRKDGNFTKKERWMIGVYIVTAVTSTLLFVITLSMISQLKVPAIDPQANDEQHESLASSTSDDWKEKYNELLNRTNDNEKQTKKLIAALHHKLTSTQNESEISANRSEKLIDMALKGWYQASNGLLYKRPRFQKSFESAWVDCKKQGARLASTGIRSADVRSDILSNVVWKNEDTWIGLNRSYPNYEWIWSDDKSFEKGDIPTYSLSYYCVAMHWEKSKIIGDDKKYCSNDYNYICEYDITS